MSAMEAKMEAQKLSDRATGVVGWWPGRQVGRGDGGPNHRCKA